MILHVLTELARCFLTSLKYSFSRFTIVYSVLLRLALPTFVLHWNLSTYHPLWRMSDDNDYDTEPYIDPTTSPEEMRFLEQDESWDNYAQSSAPTTTSSRRKPRVRRAQQQFVPLPTAHPAMPTTLPATPTIVRVDTLLTIIITVIVTVCVVASLFKYKCHCTCTLTI